uniref:Choline transporter-like protein n=1 Tax=Romanomermis culicivorax TaxID=13658 RepID=A0A915JSJ5_ROMCU
MAIVLIKEASKAVGDMSCSLFFPVIPGLIDLIMLVVWGVVVVHLFSSGQPICRYNDRTPPGRRDPSGNLVKNGSDCLCSSDTTDADPYCQFWSYSLNQLAIVGFVFCVFAVLWFGFFISGFNQMVPSRIGSIRIISDSHLTIHPLFIGYGAKFNEEKFRTCNHRSISVHGTSFYTSAKNAFNLLLKNIDRVIVLNQLTSVVLFASQLIIILVSVGIAYAFGTISLIQNLNYGWLPLVCIFIGSIIICNIFFEVFDMAVDTIFLCFDSDSKFSYFDFLRESERSEILILKQNTRMEDIDTNDGTPYYASNDLKNLLLKDAPHSL